MRHRAGALAALLSMVVHLLAGAALSPLYASNGVFPTANGPRSAGRGGADAAVADDSYALFTNPAGITQLYGLHVDNSLGFFHAGAVYTDPLNDHERNVNRFYPDANGGMVITPDFFDAARQETESFSEAELMGFDDEEETWHYKKFQPAIPTRWRFGAGLFTQGGAGADFQHISVKNYNASNDYPGGIVHRTKFVLLSFAPTVAYQLTDTLSIGAQFNVNYGRIDLRMPLSQDASILQGPDIPGLPPAFNFGNQFKLINDLFGNGDHEITGMAEVKRAQAYGWGDRVGVMWKPTDEWSFGAYWADQTHMQDFKGEAYLDFDASIVNLPSKPIPHLFEAIIRAFLVALSGEPLFTPVTARYDIAIRNFQFPQRVGFGWAYRPNRQWLFTQDVKWINWSKTFKTFTADLTNGTDNKELKVLVGGNGDIHSVIPLNWHDQWVFSEGIEYRYDDDLTLRFGTNYARNIIPPNTYLVIFPATTELHVNMGLSYKLSPNTTFDMSYEHGFKSKIRTDSHLPLGRDYNNSEYQVDQDTLLFGITYDF